MVEFRSGHLSTRPKSNRAKWDVRTVIDWFSWGDRTACGEGEVGNLPGPGRNGRCRVSPSQLATFLRDLEAALMASFEQIMRMEMDTEDVVRANVERAIHELGGKVVDFKFRGDVAHVTYETTKKIEHSVTRTGILLKED